MDPGPGNGPAEDSRDHVVVAAEGQKPPAMEEPEREPAPRRRRLPRRRAVLLSAGGFAAGWAATTFLDDLWESTKEQFTPPLDVTPRDEAYEPPVRRPATSVFDGGAQYSADFGTPGAAQYVLPVSQEQILRSQPAPDSDVDLVSWAESLGGTPAGGAIVALTVKAGEERSIDIVDIRLDIVEVAPAVSGVWLAPNGAGDYWEYTLFANLDTAPISYERQYDFSDETWSFPKNIQGDEELVIYVYAVTQTQTVHFNVLFDLYDSDRDERFTTLVDDDGAPYRVTGLSNAPTACVFTPGAGISEFRETASFFIS